MEEKIKKVLDFVASLKEERELLRAQNAQLRDKIRKQELYIEQMSNEDENLTLMREKINFLQSQNEQLKNTLQTYEKRIKHLEKENEELKSSKAEADILQQDHQVFESKVEEILSQLEKFTL
ncbi:MAG: hypothetical protein ACUVXI_12285 [bacterium]